MQVTETANEGLKRAFKVVLTADDIEDKLDARLQELSASVNLPGFRPGKVPVSLLKQRYGKSVMGEIVEKAVNDGSSQAIMERGLRPAMQPKVEITSFEEGADLEFTMELEVLPEIEPVDYAKLDLEKLVAEVDDKAVDEAVERLAAQSGEPQPIEKARKSKSGDVLVIDFVGKIDGEAFAGGTAEKYFLELGSGSFIPGFEEQLVGVDADAEVAVKVTFPSDYGNAELAGKDAVFDVTVGEIREPAPATVDDEFAKRMGSDDLEALRKSVRERIEAEYNEISQARLKRALLDALADAYEFVVPEGMVETEFEGIWKQIQEDKEAGRLPEDDQDKSEDDLKEEYRAIAERRVRLGLLLSDVGERSNLQLAREEVTNAILAEARRYPGQEKEVMEFYQNNPDAAAALRAPLFETKVVNFIIEMAKIKERKVSVEDLLRDPEEETKKPKKKAKKPAAKKPAAKKPEKTAAKKTAKSKKAEDKKSDD